MAEAVPAIANGTPNVQPEEAQTTDHGCLFLLRGGVKERVFINVGI